MEMTPEINKLAEALSKAQSEMKPAQKTGKNPHFRSSYADLNDCWGAIREPFAKYGLSVMQTINQKEGLNFLETTLAHISGQWIKSSVPVITKEHTPQALGSALSYSRRYGLCAIAGITSSDDVEDDDAERAEARSAPKAQQASATELASPAQVNYMKQLAKNAPADMIDAMLDSYGVSSFDQATKKQANEIIEKMKPQPANPQAK